MLKQEVKIKKSSINDLVTGGAQWRVRGDYEIDGQNFAGGTLVFCGFRGVRVAQGVWGGVYLFDTKGSKTPEKSITVAELNEALHVAPRATAAHHKPHTAKKRGE